MKNLETQQKAKELIEKYLNSEFGLIQEYLPKPLEYAKQCSLIVINEILNEFGSLADGKSFYTSSNTISFYEQVKIEIINYQID